MWQALQIAEWMLLLLAVQEYLRRSRPWFVWVAFLALPVAMTTHWLTVNAFGWFAWTKLCTVLLSQCWFTALRFTTFGQRTWARHVAVGLFALNILEAVMVDLGSSRLVHGLNAFAGTMLVVTLPVGRDVIRIDTDGRFRDLHFHAIGRFWLIGFTLWNWTFLYLNFPVIAGHHVAVLGAALVVGLYDPRRWLQARMTVLAVDLIAFATFGSYLIPWTGTTHWRE